MTRQGTDPSVGTTFGPKLLMVVGYVSGEVEGKKLPADELEEHGTRRETPAKGLMAKL